MATHYEDEAQVDALKKWWKDNWLAIATGLGLGLGAVFGWEAYKYFGDRQATAASQMYDDLLKSLERDDLAGAEAIAAALRERHARSVYASTAELRLAERAVREGRLEEAASRLGQVAVTAKDQGLAHLARLRLARVEVQQGRLDEALARLADPPKGFEALYLELRGDVLLLKGQRAEARQAFESALAALEPNAPHRGLLELKLADLADAGPA